MSPWNLLLLLLLPLDVLAIELPSSGEPRADRSGEMSLDERWLMSPWAVSMSEVKLVWLLLSLSSLMGFETIHLWVSSEPLSSARQVVQIRKVVKNLNLKHWLVCSARWCRFKLLVCWLLRVLFG